MSTASVLEWVGYERCVDDKLQQPISVRLGLNYGFYFY
jgi:hypothetical protein